MKKITRADLIGHKLDLECHRAKTTTNEYGTNDKRVYCYGLYDDHTENLCSKCSECKAYVHNSTPLQKELMSKESKPLQVWHLVKKYLNLYHHQAISEKVDVETVEGMPISIIEDTLKALEIIKEKGLHYLEISMFKSNLSYEDYLTEMNITIGVKPMIDSKIKTQEEYNLLKEALK